MAPPAPRVLLVSQPTTEGVAVCVRDLAKAAVAEGFDVTVACPDEGLLPKWLADAGVARVTVPLRRQPGPWDIRPLLTLRRLAADADLVHVHSSKAGALGRLAVRSLPGRRRPRCVFTPHGWSWLAGGRMAPVFRTFERVAAGMSDTTIAVSADELEAGRRTTGLDEEHLVVVENGVDADRFTPDGPVADRTAAPLLVSLGRLTRQKGHDVAVEALARSSHGDSVLRLVGDGPDRAALTMLARRLRVADRVELTGLVDDPAPHLRAADLVVLPSRWEGLSLALLEAMSCGAAVVASDVAGMRILGEAGVLVPPDEPHALARAIDRLLDDAGARAAMGHAARERIVAGYGVEASMRRTIDIWRGLLR